MAAFRLGEPVAVQVDPTQVIVGMIASRPIGIATVPALGTFYQVWTAHGAIATLAAERLRSLQRLGAGVTRSHGEPGPDGEPR